MDENSNVVHGRTVEDVPLPELIGGDGEVTWRIRWFHRIGRRMIAEGVVLETTDRTAALIIFRSKAREYVPHPSVREGFRQTVEGGEALMVRAGRRAMLGDARTGKYVVIEVVAKG